MAAIAALLLAVWTLWSLQAWITLYATTSNARLEAGGATYPLATLMAGRVMRAHLTVGRRVRAGEVLVELDSERESLALAQARTRLDGLGPAIAARREEITSQERALTAEHELRGAALDERAALAMEADAVLRLAQDEAQRIERLYTGGLAPSRDYFQARSEVERRLAAAEALRSRLKAVDPELRARESDRRARLDGLRADLRLLERDLAVERVTIARVENEIESYLVRAPVAGQIAEAVDLRPGAVLDVGDRLGSIVADGPLVVVSYFAPATSLGRIRTGQRAQVRLYGFPSAEYGSLPASVTTVAEDVRDGVIRVELAIDGPRPAISLQHGLPGEVAVEIEQVRPATLLLRSLGTYLTGAAPPQARRPAE